MKRLALFVCLLSSYAFGQGGAATSVPAITNTRGEPVPYAKVAICTSNPGPAPTTVCNGAFAATYTDITIATTCTVNPITPIGPISGTGCTNPGKSDGLGNVVAFAVPGQYWCEYYGGSITRPLVVPCFFASGSGGGASINCSIAVNGSVGFFTAPTVFTCDPTFITDGSGNWTAQSGRTLGPVNGMLGVIGGGTSPGGFPKYKLGAHEFRWLGGGVITPYYAIPPLTLGTPGQVLGQQTQTTDGNGDPVIQLAWQNGGGVTYPNAANPATPVISQGGTPGATTYSYEVVCTQDGLAASNYHSAPSAVGTTTTGNATLSNTNYNLITGYADTLYGYRGCNVYRTAGGATQGLIATNVGKAFRDTGLAGNGATPPSTNTSILDPTGPSRGSNQCNSIFHSPEGVDAPPCSPSLYTDEFTHTFGTPGDVNDGTWSIVNHGSETWAWTNGMLQITGDAAGGSVNRALFSSLAGISTPWTFTTYQSFESILQNGDCGFGLRESATGKMTLITTQQGQALSTSTGSGGMYLEISNWTSATAGSDVRYIAFQPLGGLYFQIQDTGSNLNYYYSYDGVNYQQIYTQTVATAFTTAPDQVGVDFHAVNSGVSAGTVCGWDYVRRTQ